MMKLSSAIILLIIVILGGFILVILKSNKGSFRQANSVYTGNPLYLHFNPASQPYPKQFPIKHVNANNAATKIGPRTTYWTIPRKQNPSGGWDSMDGWYQCESPDRFKETWLNSF